MSHLGIELLFLPSYSPNLNLIERLWRFTKRQAAYGRYHPTFAEFRAAVQDVLDRVPTTHAEKLASLMTLNFQDFDELSLPPYQGISCRLRKNFPWLRCAGGAPDGQGFDSRHRLQKA